MEEIIPDREAHAKFFTDLSTYEMPFGKYAGRKIHHLPLEYLIWFRERGGFPKGRLGELMAQVCAIRSEGSGHLFDHI